MRVNSEEVSASGIATCNDKVGADVALVTEEMLFEEGHDSYDAGLAASRERVEFEVGGDDGCGEFCVCSCTGSCAPDLGRDVVELLTVLESEASASCLLNVLLQRGRNCILCRLQWGRWLLWYQRR